MQFHLVLSLQSCQTNVLWYKLETNKEMKRKNRIVYKLERDLMSWRKTEREDINLQWSANPLPNNNHNLIWHIKYAMIIIALSTATKGEEQRRERRKENSEDSTSKKGWQLAQKYKCSSSTAYLSWQGAGNLPFCHHLYSVLFLLSVSLSLPLF